ncbi:cytochrome P450 [Mariannaea sp. PMI_226]|nr:cytochrome P450 [Mariannaea sp. PMI_226]
MKSLLLLPLVGILILVVRLYAYFRSPLRKVPGPRLARLSDIWYFWNVRKGNFEQTNLELHRKYATFCSSTHRRLSGSIVRYGPNRYSFSDPEAFKAIYGLGKQFAKSPWYTPWAAPGQWTVFGDQSVHHHAQTRRLYQAMYSMTSLVNYEPFVDECNDLFTQRLSEMAHAGIPFDMGHWFQCYAFDVIGMITFGKRLGYLDRGEDIGNVMAALEDHMRYATLVGIFPSLHRYLYSLKNYWAGDKGAGRAYVLSFAKDRMKEHQESPKAIPEESQSSVGMVDFLTKFFAKHAEDPERFTSYHIMAGCSSNMVAGSDTTAISLSAILYYLLSNPSSMKKLQDEIQEHEAQGNLSDYPTFQESQQMPYLQAVVKEALRLHPATQLPLERVVPEGGVTISGHYFPPGTIVGINSWVAHYDPRFFGEDADTFRPERWLNVSQDEITLMNQYWMPFGLGSRTCIGRHVSMLEISKLIPKLIRDFEFSLNSQRGYARVADRWETNGFWFVKPRGFNIRARVRSTAEKQG